MPSKKDLLLQAQLDQLHEIAKLRLSVLHELDELKGFGGTDDYKVSLEAIVVGYGTEGVSLTRVREVLPDPIQLKDALDKLKTEGKLHEEPQGRSSLLTPATPAAAE